MIENKKKIFFWSPLLGNVGTVGATIKSAESLSSDKNYDIFIINVLGEFNFYINNSSNIKVINIFPFLTILPKTGIFSKISIYFFSILSFPILIWITIKYKPSLIISSLVGFIPLILKKIFPKIKIFNSIQGYPRFNYLRKFIWQKLYLKSDLIITMTNNTRLKLIDEFVKVSNIITLFNPIIDEKIRILSNEKIHSKHNYLFKNKNLIAIGRLTKQKNFMELLIGFNNFKLKLSKNLVKDNFNLLILGDGEELKYLKEFVNKETIKNVYFMGFQKNPFNFLKKSDLYLSTSLWEDPGHTLIEAASLSVPIVTSLCPSGPKELFNSKNAFCYENGNSDKLANIIYQFFNDKSEIFQLDLQKKINNALLLSSSFNKKDYYNTLKKFIS